MEGNIWVDIAQLIWDRRPGHMGVTLLQGILGQSFGTGFSALHPVSEGLSKDWWNY